MITYRINLARRLESDICVIEVCLLNDVKLGLV